MNQKFIGVSPRFNIDSTSGQRFIKINMDYIKQIVSYNYTPLILFDCEDFENNLKLCSGFLILGGNDINPIYFNENNNLELSKGIDEITDELDRRIITFAKENKVPTLGICRGHQALAAFLGGSLHQDINHANLNHPENEKKHYVTKVANTNLTNLLPDNFLVNTFHHQAVNLLPEGFITTLMNGDVIEAIEHKDLPLIGVQWHPERYYTNESKIIFDYFYDQVKIFEQNKKCTN